MSEPRYVRNPALLADDSGDGLVILDADRARVIELNQSGARLWRRLATAATAAELVRHLADAHPKVPAATLALDVARFLRDALACQAVLEATAG